MTAFRKTLIAVGSVLAFAGAAFAQNGDYPPYPHKTVTLITSSGPGRRPSCWGGSANRISGAPGVVV